MKKSSITILFNLSQQSECELNEKLTYYSLSSILVCHVQDSRDLYSECLRTFWSCPNCDLYMPLTPLERMTHEASCRPAGEQQQLEEEGQHIFFCNIIFIRYFFKFISLTVYVLLFFLEAGREKATSSSVSSLTRVFHCDVCNEDLTLTPTEILKHKRQHMYSVK